MGRRTCGTYQKAVNKLKYARQFTITEINRKRKQAKHLRLQQKKLLRKR